MELNSPSSSSRVASEYKTEQNFIPSLLKHARPYSLMYDVFHIVFS